MGFEVVAFPSELWGAPKWNKSPRCSIASLEVLHALLLAWRLHTRWQVTVHQLVYRVSECTKGGLSVFACGIALQQEVQYGGLQLMIGRPA